jgi:hypothetical protein
MALVERTNVLRRVSIPPTRCLASLRSSFETLQIHKNRHVNNLPDELLSIIFIEYSRNYWNGPFTIAAVCHRWREVVLVTARAWSFFDSLPLSQSLSMDEAEYRLTRLHAITTCLNLQPSTKPAVVEVVFNHTANIRCLSGFDISQYLWRNFPELEELRLGDYSRCGYTGRDSEQPMTATMGNIPPRSLLDKSRFLKLHTLHLHSPSIYTLNLIAIPTGFPPLQHLHISNHGSFWWQIIQNCANTLVSLGVGIIYANSIDCSPLLLPNVTHLTIVIDGSAHISPVQPPKFITPSLVTYHEISSANWVAPVHQDLSTVTDVVLFPVKTIDWNKFPNLITAAVTARCPLVEQTCDDLGNNPHLCPKLAQIDFSAWDESQILKVNRSQARQSLGRRTIHTRVHIISTFQGSQQEFDCAYSEVRVYLYDPLPSLIISQCYTHCTCNRTYNNPYNEVIY